MKASWTPRVTIIIPVYNGANYMREAIDSALSQTYRNIEVLVVNDGSTDNGETDKIALSYGDRITYIKKENGGVSSALNLGIEKMSGEYFSWLSHDDVYTPEKVSRQIEALSSVENKRAVGLCGHCFINDKSERLSKSAPSRFTNGAHTSRTVIREILKNGAFSGCSLLVPKVAFDECGLFHEGLRFSQDALMWMNIFLKDYSLVYNADADVLSRIHGKQLTQNGRAVFQKDSLTIARLVAPDLLRISDKKDNYLYLFAKRNAKYGNRDAVKICIEVAKAEKLFGIGHRLILEACFFYGSLRPALRKVYYALFIRAK